MAVVSITYDEGKKKNLGYKSVNISYGINLKKKKSFASGDFVKDWYDCNKFIITKLSDTDEFFLNSSSVDHFIMDGAPYRSAYLVTGENTADLHYERKYHGQAIEFFVPTGTKPSWKELRNMCGDRSKNGSKR